MTPLFALFTPGPTTLLIVLVLAILLFGKKLPEIGKSVGKAFTEFNKGLHGVEDVAEVRSPGRIAPTAVEPTAPPQKVAVTGPRFEDPSATQPAHPMSLPPQG
jgi:sec-independent protein translocase protein TatA